jgi:hypothetical protein
MDPVIAELIDELEANRAMFSALCLACGPRNATRAAPGDRWLVHDHMAHVASYDQLAIGHLVAGAASGPEPDATLRETGNGDAWNEAEVQRRSGRDSASLVDEMERLRERSLVLLAASTAGDLEREVYFPGDARRASSMVPLRLWLRYWSKHDMVHAQAIVRSVPELGANDDFRSWLADDPLLDALSRTAELESGRGDHGVTG